MSSIPQNYSSNQGINSSGISNRSLDAMQQNDIIAQLKSQIFDLEQNEKNYEALLSKYKTLSNDTSILNEEKIRLEYELKQKTETSNKIICDLQTENENLQNALNEKLATNKTLYNDNNNLFASLEQKNCENEKLRNALQERDDIIDKLSDEKKIMKKQFQCLQKQKIKTNKIYKN